MKAIQGIAMVSILAVAAGCAHHGHYDEGFTPSAFNANGNEAARIDSAKPSANAGESDNQISASVREAFLRDPEMAFIAPNIDVTANNGTVTLNGNVQSEEQKHQVELLAGGVPGVLAVNNQLEAPALRPPAPASEDNVLGAQSAADTNNVANSLLTPTSQTNNDATPDIQSTNQNQPNPAP